MSHLIGVCCMHNIPIRHTTAFHFQTNPQAELFIQTLLTTLCYYVADHVRTWDELKESRTFACNTQPHSSTSFASFEHVLARPPTLLELDVRPAEMRQHNPRQW